MKLTKATETRSDYVSMGTWGYCKSAPLALRTDMTSWLLDFRNITQSQCWVHLRGFFPEELEKRPESFQITAY